MEALLSCARCQRHCHRRKASPLSLPTKSCQPHLPVVKVEETKGGYIRQQPGRFEQHVQATWRLPKILFRVFIAQLLRWVMFACCRFSRVMSSALSLALILIVLSAILLAYDNSRWGAGYFPNVELTT